MADERLGVADPRHHVLALRVEEEVAVGAGLARGRVAGEAHPGARAVVAVAEDHDLHVDRGAEVVGDVLARPVGGGPGRVPGAEDRLDRGPQLVPGLLGEGLAGVALDQLGQLDHHELQLVGGHGAVGGGAAAGLGRLERPVELLAVDAEHDAAVHLQEAAVGVVGEAPIGLAGEALDRRVVEPEVQDGVHHPRHRVAGPRAHRHEQRVGGVAERAAHAGLQRGEVAGDLVVEVVGPAAAQVVAAGVGGDREAGRAPAGPARSSSRRGWRPCPRAGRPGGAAAAGERGRSRRRTSSRCSWQWSWRSWRVPFPALRQRIRPVPRSPPKPARC